MITGKRITDEVRRIMGPSTSKSLCYSSSNSSLIGTGQINRNKKRKSNLKIVSSSASAKRSRASTSRFQKKLVVFKYMGKDGPDTFTRTDKRIAVRGLLPPIPVDASESDVRREICDVIRSCSDYVECSPDDFQFIDMNGKQASIPKCKVGFLWDGRAVKELAGSGCLYVRLTSNVGVSSESSSSDESQLPNISVTRRRNDEDNDVVIIEDTSSVGAGVSQNVSSDQPPSTRSQNSDSSSNSSGAHLPSSHNVQQLQSDSSCDRLPSTDPSVLPSTSTLALQAISGKPDEGRDLAKLAEIFPQLSVEQLRYVYSLPTRTKFDSAVQCLSDGPTLEALRSLVVMRLVIPFSESPCIRVDAEADDEEMVGTASAYYKNDRFNKAAYVKISMKRQPGIDTGGIRRQFFSTVLADIALSRSVKVFDGPIHRLRPSFRASNLSSGLLSTIGAMIGHSLLMDGYGFPYLSEYCYYYIAGYTDKAITCITTEDVGEQVKQVVEQVCGVLGDSLMNVSYIHWYGVSQSLLETSYIVIISLVGTILCLKY